MKPIRDANNTSLRAKDNFRHLIGRLGESLGNICNLWGIWDRFIALTVIISGVALGLELGEMRTNLPMLKLNDVSRI